jgi:hypothetical protein
VSIEEMSIEVMRVEWSTYRDSLTLGPLDWAPTACFGLGHLRRNVRAMLLNF